MTVGQKGILYVWGQNDGITCTVTDHQDNGYLGLKASDGWITFSPDTGQIIGRNPVVAGGWERVSFTAACVVVAQPDQGHPRRYEWANLA